jgi:hypothetical protein
MLTTRSSNVTERPNSVIQGVTTLNTYLDETDRNVTTQFITKHFKFFLQVVSVTAPGFKADIQAIAIF